jgi:tetratricopeptide (TPR) repeat protein
MPVIAVVTTSLDPDADDHLDLDAPSGVRLVRVPALEIATLIGFRAYQELLVELCAADPAGVLIVRPPWDFLDDATSHRIGAAGTRIVAATADVLLAAAPRPAAAQRTPDHEVLLVGERSPRREAFVDRLRAAGVNVIAKGLGWESGPISRAQRDDLSARAAVVLTTWPDGAPTRALVETAMLGVFQLAQDAPELRRLFSEDEVPSFGHPEELVERVEAALADTPGRRRAAQAARARALREHTFAARWPTLVGDLDLALPALPVTAGPRSRAHLYEQMLLVLGSRAETEDRPSAAVALFGELLARAPDEPTAAAGLGRCLRDLGLTEQALAPLRIAAAAAPPTFLARRAAAVPGAGAGSGFGRLAIAPPAAEPICFLLASLVELGRDDEALALADSLNDIVLVDAVTQALGGDLPPALKDKLAEKFELLGRES